MTLTTIPNYLAGSWSEDGDTKVLVDALGEPSALIHSATDRALRSAKRRLMASRPALEAIPLSTLVDVIGRVPAHYFRADAQVELLARLTGCARRVLDESLDKRRSWCAGVERFLEATFGVRDGEGFVVPGFAARRQLVPKGPVVAILPSNSDEESLHIVLQALLSRSPILVRGSSSGPSTFSAVELVRALAAAATEIDADLAAAVLGSIAVVNLFGTAARSDIVEKLHLDDASYVVFGSNETLTEVRTTLGGRAHGPVLSFGTGFASAFVRRDADLALAAHEIAESAKINNGNECVATTVVYVESGCYDAFVEALSAHAGPPGQTSRGVVGDSRGLAKTDALLGAMLAPQRAAALRALEALSVPAPSWLHEGPTSFSVIERRADEPVDEVPAPIVFVKRVADVEDAIRNLESDLARAGQARGIATAVFGSTAAALDRIPAHTVRMNRGTHHMNMFLEHQGRVLLRELVSVRLIEP